MALEDSVGIYNAIEQIVNNNSPVEVLSLFYIVSFFFILFCFVLQNLIMY
jgi:hypothetical protein